MTPYTHIVRYYECDRMGITHHSNYARFMEEARIDWMDQLGYGFERMEAEGVVSPVMAIELHFKQPTTFKDAIQIEVSVTDLTALKIEVLNADGSSTEPVPAPAEPDVPVDAGDLDDMPF